MMMSGGAFCFFTTFPFLLPQKQPILFQFVQRSTTGKTQTRELDLRVFSSCCSAKTVGGNRRRRLRRTLRFQAHVRLCLLTCVGSSY